MNVSFARRFTFGFWVAVCAISCASTRTQAQAQAAAAPVLAPIVEIDLSHQKPTYDAGIGKTIRLKVLTTAVAGKPTSNLPDPGRVPEEFYKEQLDGQSYWVQYYHILNGNLSVTVNSNPVAGSSVPNPANFTINGGGAGGLPVGTVAKRLIRLTCDSLGNPILTDADSLKALAPNDLHVGDVLRINAGKVPTPSNLLTVTLLVPPPPPPPAAANAPLMQLGEAWSDHECEWHDFIGAAAGIAAISITQKPPAAAAGGAQPAALPTTVAYTIEIHKP